MRLDLAADPMFRQAAVVFLVLSWPQAQAHAATMMPPMLDITRQCDVIARHNATAMSECVVAESEARSEILQKWANLPEAHAATCVKLGRKAKRYPYTAMAKCLSDAAQQEVRPVAPARPDPAPVAAAAPVPTLAAPAPPVAKTPSDNPFQTFKKKLFGN